MNPTRYILTRTCLQEGSLRLLKFNEFYFPQSGPVTFVDERGKEYTAQVDRDAMQVTGLSDLYHDHNLSVNDVLTITPGETGRYEIGMVVKPYSTARSRQGRRSKESEPRNPGVREVRTPPQSLTGRQKRSGPTGGGGRNLSGMGEERRNADAAPATLKPIAAAFTPQLPQSGRPELTLEAPLFPPPARGSTTTVISAAPENAEKAAAPEPRPAATPVSPAVTQDQVAEFARLTGYRLTLLGHGLIRLNADLSAPYGYSVLIATEPMATTYPEWDSADDHHVLITSEEERSAGIPRLTREALAALTEHARLAHLGALDLRGYWRAGDINLDSAASVAELVSTHLAKRGAFTYVLLILSQQPAHSVISLSDLAQRVGSGASLDEMKTILDTLSRAPFLALTPLPDEQYLLRLSVADLLSELTEYAQGVRRRLRGGGSAGAGSSTSTPSASASTANASTASTPIAEVSEPQPESPQAEAPAAPSAASSPIRELLLGAEPEQD